MRNLGLKPEAIEESASSTSGGFSDTKSSLAYAVELSLLQFRGSELEANLTNSKEKVNHVRISKRGN